MGWMAETANQQWRFEPSSTTVNSYGPVHTMSSLACPDENVILQQGQEIDAALAFGFGLVVNQWHLHDA